MPSRQGRSSGGPRDKSAVHDRQEAGREQGHTDQTQLDGHQQEDVVERDLGGDELGDVGTGG